MAGKAFEVGDLVLSTPPYSFVLHAQHRDSRCSFCFASSDDLHRCAGCKQEKYCGPNCQAAAWKAYHKAECSHLRNAPTAAMILPDCVR